MFEIIKPQCEYWIYGFEVAPETGTPHLQCYIVFNNPKEPRSCHKIFPSHGHWEKQSPLSTPQQCAEYCKKGVEPLLND